MTDNFIRDNPERKCAICGKQATQCVAKTVIVHGDENNSKFVVMLWYECANHKKYDREKYVNSLSEIGLKNVFYLRPEYLEEVFYNYVETGEIFGIVMFNDDMAQYLMEKPL